MDTRGEHRFSSLVKQNKKGKNYAVFCFAGKKKLLFYIYAVIVKQNFYKRSSNYYWPMAWRCGGEELPEGSRLESKLSL
jgi:hypothetical protein